MPITKLGNGEYAITKEVTSTVNVFTLKEQIDQKKAQVEIYKESKASQIREAKRIHDEKVAQITKDTEANIDAVQAEIAELQVQVDDILAVDDKALEKPADLEPDVVEEA